MEMYGSMDNRANDIEYSKTEPILTPIKNGWAARGKGWAVHGKTKEEAIEKYHEAEARHHEIDQRLFGHERRRQEDSQEDES
jgi:hypothetical protein